MNTLEIVGMTGASVSIAKDAHSRKTELIEEAKLVTQVTDRMSADLASQTLVSIRGLMKLCEDSRQAVKEPVLKLGREIDAKAKEFISGIDHQSARIGALVGIYQAEQQRIIQEAERKRQEELQRIERERLAAEESARKKAEAEQRAARNEEERRAAAARAEQAKREADARAVAQANTVAVAPVAQKLQGVSTRPVWKFEVLNPGILYSMRPELVNLTPRTDDINRVIAAGAREIPGLRIYETTETKVRA